VLILASGSPQRRAILEQIGVAFEVVVPEVEELGGGDPRATVVENALRKARAVEGPTVLAADTVVVIDGDVLGKPADEAEAERFLRRLSGRTHEVWGGVALREDGEERTANAVTSVRFAELEQADIEWYLGTGEWEGRAGGYAIQGKGALLVSGIDGDFWNVVGLPMAELRRLGLWRRLAAGR
jgi:nucleoside triphosphate pyrophosphatase